MMWSLLAFFLQLGIAAMSIMVMVAVAIITLLSRAVVAVIRLALARRHQQPAIQLGEEVSDRAKPVTRETPVPSKPPAYRPFRY
jgi:predicted lipid-binding transport protein (Tim44 family)